MKKVLLFILPIFLALLVFFGFLVFSSRNAIGKGALQVTAIPQSNVYLNNRLIGKTPLCKCDPASMIPTGDYDIRVVPINSVLANEAFEQKISINKAVLTVVDRTFGPGAASTGSVISLLPQEGNSSLAGLFVASFPDGSDISLDDNPNGTTPLRLSSLTESDHNLLVHKSGYKDKQIRIHAVKGYVLSVIAFLGVDLSASSSAGTVPVASPTSSAQQIVVLSTPTGFLRVHKDATITSAEIGQVKPSEQYDLLNEKTGWYEIKLASGSGWISSSYAKKQ